MMIMDGVVAADANLDPDPNCRQKNQSREGSQ